MGGKGRGMWGSTLEKGPRAGMLKRILGGEVREKTFGKYIRGIEGSAGEERSTRVWSKTQSKEQFRWLRNKRKSKNL